MYSRVQRVFRGDQTNEVRMGFVVIEGELDQTAYRLDGRVAVQVQSGFKSTDVGVGLLQNRQI